MKISAKATLPPNFWRHSCYNSELASYLTVRSSKGLTFLFTLVLLAGVDRRPKRAGHRPAVQPVRAGPAEGPSSAVLGRRSTLINKTAGPIHMQKDVILQISNKIKEKRKERNITIQELADKAGVTKGFISQIENNRTVPSLSVLLSIIKSLHIDLNTFFDELQGENGEGEKVLVMKKSKYQDFQKENARGFLYQRILSTHIQDKHIDIVLLRLQKNSRRAMVRTDAFEYKYMISGKVEYTIGEKKHLLEAGDSIYFDAREPHNPKNVGEEEAVMLVIYFFIEK